MRLCVLRVPIRAIHTQSRHMSSLCSTNPRLWNNLRRRLLPMRCFCSLLLTIEFKQVRQCHKFVRREHATSLNWQVHLQSREVVQVALSLSGHPGGGRRVVYFQHLGLGWYFIFVNFFALGVFFGQIASGSFDSSFFLFWNTVSH